MDKQQKQVEEVTRSCTDCIHYEICSLWTTTDLDEEEAHKYCFGRYRPKIHENAVVLTEKEYGELYQRMFDEVRQANDLKVEQARKETAEKIMTDISSDILVVNTREYGNIEVVPMERLQEICGRIVEGK